MGFESLDKFLVSLTDVLEVRQLSEGHQLLVGLADCRTRHMARMVAGMLAARNTVRECISALGGDYQTRAHQVSVRAMGRTAQSGYGS